MESRIDLPLKDLILILCDFNQYKFWHDQVTEGDVKMKLSSDNTIIGYQKHQAYSHWYRERDFLFVRHLFKNNDYYYLVDKSI